MEIPSNISEWCGHGYLEVCLGVTLSHLCVCLMCGREGVAGRKLSRTMDALAKPPSSLSCRTCRACLRIFGWPNALALSLIDFGA